MDRTARLEGKVLQHAGEAAQPSFSEDEEHTHARNHEPLYRVVATAAGDVVVEVFAIHAPRCPDTCKSSVAVRSIRTHDVGNRDAVQ